MSRGLLPTAYSAYRITSGHQRPVAFLSAHVDPPKNPTPGRRMWSIPEDLPLLYMKPRGFPDMLEALTALGRPPGLG